MNSLPDGTPLPNTKVESKELEVCLKQNFMHSANQGAETPQESGNKRRMNLTPHKCFRLSS